MGINRIDIFHNLQKSQAKVSVENYKLELYCIDYNEYLYHLKLNY